MLERGVLVDASGGDVGEHFVEPEAVVERAPLQKDGIGCWCVGVRERETVVDQVQALGGLIPAEVRRMPVLLADQRVE